MQYTQHALKQAARRGLSRQDIVMAVSYGRRIFKGNGAVLYFLGQREVCKQADLRPYLGIHVLCDVKHDEVITVYRNRKLRFHSNMP